MKTWGILSAVVEIFNNAFLLFCVIVEVVVISIALPFKMFIQKKYVIKTVSIYVDFHRCNL